MAALSKALKEAEADEDSTRSTSRRRVVKVAHGKADWGRLANGCRELSSATGLFRRHTLILMVAPIYLIRTNHRNLALFIHSSIGFTDHL